MIADSNGNALIKNTVVPFKMRLQKSDDIYFSGYSVIAYSGAKGKILNRY